MVEIHKSVARPELFLELFAGHQLAASFDKQLQNLKRLFAELQLQAVLVQLTRKQIQLEGPKVGDGEGLVLGHGGFPGTENDVPALGTET